MAAQGAHAVWYDETSRQLVLPWDVKLLVSFVPPVSGLATLHLVVNMAEDLIATVRLLVAEPVDELVDGPPARPLSPSVESRVLRMVRANPTATWRVVRARTGLTEANAKRALTAARKALQAASEVDPEQVDDPAPDARGHRNGSGA